MPLDTYLFNTINLNDLINEFVLDIKLNKGFHLIDTSFILMTLCKTLLLGQKNFQFNRSLQFLLSIL